MSIIHDIQEDILNPSIPLSSALRRATVLAFRLQSNELKEWIRQEQNGYNCELDELPIYRKLITESFGHFHGAYGREIRNAPIPTLALPDELHDIASNMPLFQGIRELEGLLEGDGLNLTILWPANYLAFLQHVPIYQGMICVQAWKIITKSEVQQILDTVRNRLLEFVLELEQINPDIGEEPDNAQTLVSQEEIRNIFHQCIFYESPINQGAKMTTFDQRNQQVGYQYNAAGNINFGSIQTPADLLTELEKFKEEFDNAVQAGIFDEDVAIDAEYEVKKAIQEAKKPEPNKQTILERLQGAKALIAGVAAAAGLIKALAEAADVVKHLF